MDDVRFVEVSDEQTVADWQRIHNAIIPTDPLSLDEVRERSGRHRLEVAYVDAPDGQSAVGNSTVRRPTDDDGAMVIARVLPPYRRRGIGTMLFQRGLEAALSWADERPVRNRRPRHERGRTRLRAGAGFRRGGALHAARSHHPLHRARAARLMI